MSDSRQWHDFLILLLPTYVSEYFHFIVKSDWAGSCGGGGDGDGGGGKTGGRWWWP